MFNINFLLMAGLEPQTSGIGSDCSTNWATTTALKASVLERERELAKLSKLIWLEAGQYIPESLIVSFCFRIALFCFFVPIWHWTNFIKNSKFLGNLVFLQKRFMTLTTFVIRATQLIIKARRRDLSKNMMIRKIFLNEWF